MLRAPCASLACMWQRSSVTRFTATARLTRSVPGSRITTRPPASTQKPACFIDFAALVQYVCDWDRSTATGWVQRLPGGGVARRVVSRSRRVRQNESFLSEAKLALFTEPPEEALRQRDLRREEAMHYGIRWNPH